MRTFIFFLLLGLALPLQAQQLPRIAVESIRYDTLTTVQRDALSSAREGEVIFNISTGQMERRSGSAWARILDQTHVGIDGGLPLMARSRTQALALTAAQAPTGTLVQVVGEAEPFVIAAVGTVDECAVLAMADGRRLVRQKRPGTINVQWCGAVGDNTTDDSAAILAAIAAADSGEVVLFPNTGALYYTGTTTLEITKPGIVLRGEGIAHEPKASAGIRYAGQGEAVHFDGPSEALWHVGLEQLHIKLDNDKAIGVRMEDIRNGFVRNNVVVGSGRLSSTNTCVLVDNEEATWSGYPDVSGNQMWHCKEFITFLGQVTAGSVRNNRIQGLQDPGIVTGSKAISCLTNACNGTLIYDNKADGVDYAVFLTTNQPVEVLHNRFETIPESYYLLGPDTRYVSIVGGIHSGVTAKPITNLSNYSYDNTLLLYDLPDETLQIGRQVSRHSGEHQIRGWSLFPTHSYKENYLIQEDSTSWVQIAEVTLDAANQQVVMWGTLEARWSGMTDPVRTDFSFGATQNVSPSGAGTGTLAYSVQGRHTTGEVLLATVENDGSKSTFKLWAYSWWARSVLSVSVEWTETVQGLVKMSHIFPPLRETDSSTNSTRFPAGKLLHTDNALHKVGRSLEGYTLPGGFSIVGMRKTSPGALTTDGYIQVIDPDGETRYIEVKRLQ